MGARKCAPVLRHSLKLTRGAAARAMRLSSNWKAWLMAAGALFLALVGDVTLNDLTVHVPAKAMLWGAGAMFLWALLKESHETTKKLEESGIAARLRLLEIETAHPYLTIGNPRITRHSVQPQTGRPPRATPWDGAVGVIVRAPTESVPYGCAQLTVHNLPLVAGPGHDARNLLTRVAVTRADGSIIQGHVHWGNFCRDHRIGEPPVPESIEMHFIAVPSGAVVEIAGSAPE